MASKRKEQKKTTQLYRSLHIGHKKAFGKWYLIWVDVDDYTHMEIISKQTAKALMAAGMNYEG